MTLILRHMISACRRNYYPPISCFLLVGIVSSCSVSRPSLDPALEPESSSGFRDVERTEAKTFMVTTANPKATQAAAAVIEEGGSAVDAVLTAQFVLGVVEPQSSGIGGGAFLVVSDAASSNAITYDGRETAPARMAPDAFLDGNGEVREFLEVLIGGLSVGVPGVIKLAQKAHAAHGRLPWSRLFEPAIGLAEDGWYVDPRLANGIRSAPELLRYAGQDSMFFDADGEPRQVGEWVRNPALARTLKSVAASNGDDFYQGVIGKGIVATATSHQNAGSLTMNDFELYRVRKDDALCVDYRRFRVCGAPPPAGSGVVLTILKLLENKDVAKLDPTGTAFIHLFVQAAELAYADRDRYYGDPAFADVPIAKLFDPERLRSGISQITTDRRSTTPLALAEVVTEQHDHKLCESISSSEGSLEAASTSHISVIDRMGNAAAMTSSVESNFGSRIMSGGFILNNQLTDFDFSPCRGRVLRANAVEPGKRPRSSMSPLLVFDENGEVVLVAGSPGGAAIIAYTAQTAIAVLDQGLNPQDAVSLPHVLGRDGKTILEDHPGLDDTTVEALRALGHDIQLRPLTSGLSVIARTSAGFAGGADPRRDGVAQGD